MNIKLIAILAIIGISVISCSGGGGSSVTRTSNDLDYSGIPSEIETEEVLSTICEYDENNSEISVLITGNANTNLVYDSANDCWINFDIANRSLNASFYAPFRYKNKWYASSLINGTVNTYNSEDGINWEQFANFARNSNISTSALKSFKAGDDSAFVIQDGFRSVLYTEEGSVGEDIEYIYYDENNDEQSSSSFDEFASDEEGNWIVKIDNKYKYTTKLNKEELNSSVDIVVEEGVEISELVQELGIYSGVYYKGDKWILLTINGIVYYSSDGINFKEGSRFFDETEPNPNGGKEAATYKTQDLVYFNDKLYLTAALGGGNARYMFILNDYANLTNKSIIWDKTTIMINQSSRGLTSDDEYIYLLATNDHEVGDKGDGKLYKSTNGRNWESVVFNLETGDAGDGSEAEDFFEIGNVLGIAVKE